jgi:hypothetical protein
MYLSVLKQHRGDSLLPAQSSSQLLGSTELASGLGGGDERSCHPIPCDCRFWNRMEVHG